MKPPHGRPPGGGSGPGRGPRRPDDQRNRNHGDAPPRDGFDAAPRRDGTGDGERPPARTKRPFGARPTGPRPESARFQSTRPEGGNRFDDRAPRRAPSTDSQERAAPSRGGRTVGAKPTSPRPEAPRGEAPQRTEERAPRRAPPPDRQESWTTPRPGHGGAGGHWLYGLHAVAAALTNPSRRLRRLVLTQEAEATLAARIRQALPIPAERMDRGQIDRLLGRDPVHQGIALLADPLPPPQLNAVLERPGPLLVLDQVTDPRNIGAILRSAAAFGAAAVVVQDRSAPEETGTMAKAASGALETVPLLRAVNLARTLVALKAAGVWVVGLDSDGTALSGPALAERRVALVLGAEGEGMRRLTRETCDEIAGLPMPGGFESLNVSAAAAVALYEVSRR